MEKPVPMERLLCGDVGYGKTEVAIRAAFKAVMDGKQVAVMAPTTVLAQQHLITFQNRMDAFGVRIEMLSRFRSRKEQKDTLDKLAKGDLDIVIGTHRLIQPDVHFKDLGLLIIDEEQRLVWPEGKNQAVEFWHRCPYPVGNAYSADPPFGLGKGTGYERHRITSGRPIASRNLCGRIR